MGFPSMRSKNALVENVTSPQNQHERVNQRLVMSWKALLLLLLKGCAAVIEQQVPQNLHHQAAGPGLLEALIPITFFVS